MIATVSRNQPAFPSAGFLVPSRLERRRSDQVFALHEVRHVDAGIGGLMRAAAVAAGVAADKEETAQRRACRRLVPPALPDDLTETDALAALARQDVVARQGRDMAGAVALLRLHACLDAWPEAGDHCVELVPQRLGVSEIRIGRAQGTDQRALLARGSEATIVDGRDDVEDDQLVGDLSRLQAAL